LACWRKATADRNPSKSSGSHHRAARTFRSTFSSFPKSVSTLGPAKHIPAVPRATRKVFHLGASMAALIIRLQTKPHSFISFNPYLYVAEYIYLHCVV
jgi:hypothetical protein